MRIKVDFSAVRQTRWFEYATRFAFGGLVTVATGIIAQKYGPSVGGLFLAFPAIFPASLSLVDKHTREKKERAGLNGKNRGRTAAALDARGGAKGALGLLAFALTAGPWLPSSSSWKVLPIALVVWFWVSASIWRSSKHLRRFPKRRCARESD
jgi:hypothetical protein